MEFYEDGDEVISIWKPQPQFQGWIDTLHGGIQAVLLDEICAWVILRKMQTTGVTSKMETRYMKPISTNDSHIVLRASIKEVKRNIILVDAAIYNNKEELCTKALCTYFTFSTSTHCNAFVGQASTQAGPVSRCQHRSHLIALAFLREETTSIAPNGQASIQLLQPMQRVCSTKICPCSRLIASTGQTFAHGASSH